MAAHSLETLLRLWALGNLTTEQAIGQLIQILNELEPRVKRLEQAIVAVPTATPPPAPAPTPMPTPPAVNPSKRPRRS